MDEKICESCTMPMKKIEDFGGGNPHSRFCVHCTYDDGKLKTYEDMVAGLVHLIKMDTGKDTKVATKIAKENLKKIPLWKDHE